MRITALKLISTLILVSGLSLSANADETHFHQGVVFPEFGKIASVDADFKIPKNAVFHVAFDGDTASKLGEVNRTLNSVARFFNMHLEAGVSEKNIKVAVVVHGSASVDLTNSDYFEKRFEGDINANAAIIEALTNRGVRIILCGQSAAYNDITRKDLLPGVEMALSAMTAHALLQQDGYTLNPF